MKSKIKNIWWLVCAVLVLLSIPVFWANRTVIEVNIPLITGEDLKEKEEQTQKISHAVALRNTKRRIFECQVDDDCIIVDKDPCGCIAGPSGVTAINAAMTVDYENIYHPSQVKECPNKAPSVLRECSPRAQAVCREKTCKIIY